MKKTTLAISIGFVILLTGCSIRQQATPQTPPKQSEQNQTDPRQPEDVMTDSQTETDATLQAPALQKTDDVKGIEADLNNTVISQESF